MKILMVHNDYGRYSGEEAVVDQLIADRKQEGYEVVSLRRTTQGFRDTITGQIHGLVSGVYSVSGRRMMRVALRQHQPDIVHVHNLYPFIGPAALFECKKANVPVVMTVHNFRLLCPTGLFLREGKPCEECLVRGNEWNCIKHNCEHSYAKSIGYALRNFVARSFGSYIRNVDYYCCLTEFQKQKLTEGGFPEERIFVLPNYLPEINSIASECLNDKGKYVGYVGRLSHEKGFDLLLEVAKRHPEIEFRFAGFIREGETFPTLPNAHYCGMLTKEELSSFYDDASFIVLPSRCYEGFPLTILEAYSHGRTCIVPNHGPFPELVSDNGKKCGLLFEPSDIDDLEKQVVHLWNHPQERLSLCQNAAIMLKEHFVKDILSKQWNDFYNMVVANTK